MTTLHIHLFGQLRLFWQERPYPFKALPKVEPLLVYLLLHQDAPVQRDSLAFKLWPDATEKQAKGRLRRHLHDLRRALPPAPNDQPWLLLTAQTAQWNPAAPYWLVQT
jgi:DNA-binding SARP family transcriptional activator